MSDIDWTKVSDHVRVLHEKERIQRAEERAEEREERQLKREQIEREKISKEQGGRINLFVIALVIGFLVAWALTSATPIETENGYQMLPPNPHLQW